jgi:hypothetical protein
LVGNDREFLLQLIRTTLQLVLEVLEMEAEAREQRKITRLRRARRFHPAKPSRHWMRARCPRR